MSGAKGGRSGEAPGHVPALDGVRGVAILLVLLAHLDLPIREGLRAGLGAAPKFFQAGWAGVDLFFALSGFLITGILADTKAGAHYLRNFYMRRALRIFPLYYGFLAAVFLVGPAVGAFRGLTSALGRDQAWFWLYGTNFLALVRGGRFPLFHFWSLAVEEHFYLAWPLVVLALPRRRLMAACLALIVASTAARALLEGRISPVAIHVLTPCRLDGLAAGAFAALAIRGPGGVGAALGPARAVALLGTAALAALAAWRGEFSELDPAVQVAGFTLLGVTSAALVTLAAGRGGVVPWAMDRRPLKALGKYSYGMYVYHVSVIAALGRLGIYDRLLAGLRTPWLASPALLAAMTAATLALAWVSWHLFERRFLALKRYFSDSRPRGAAPAPVVADEEGALTGARP